MAHYRASLDVSLSCDEAFDYLSDFSTTQEWDPGVVRAVRLDEGDVRVGSEFALTARFLGRTAPLTYEVIEYHRPLAVTFRGENATVVSRDRITFESAEGGTRIVYDADLSLKGPLRVADPLLRLAFKPVGDRALAGLRERLSGRVDTAVPPVEAR
jgi:hypothetical protein